MRFVVAALVCLPLAGEVKLSFSPQPPELTRIAFGRIGERLETWQVTVCHDGDAPEIIPAGRIYQEAQGRNLATLDRAMALSAVLRAKNRHPAALAARVVGYASILAGALAGAQVIKAGKMFDRVLPLVGLASHQLGSELAGRIPEERLQRFDQVVLADEIRLAPRGCGSKVVFAARRRGANPIAAPKAAR